MPAEKLIMKDLSKGDFCYFKIPNSGVRKYYFGEVKNIFMLEDCFCVLTNSNGYHIVHYLNAAWSEKEIKKMIYQKPPNTYKQDSEDKNDQQTSKRKHKICNGKNEKSKANRPKKSGADNCRVSKSKQEVVRSPAKPKVKTRRRRKTSRKKK